MNVVRAGFGRAAPGNLPEVRVVHHPFDHPYVHHACGSSGVRADVWDVGALRAAAVDVVHLHFGFETRSAAELAHWAAALRSNGIALVHTVHDLDNPHLVDQAPFHRLVEVLVRAADHLLTLTDSAAAEVAARFGRRPAVVAHPHVVPLERMAARRSGRRRGVYVHAATVRPNLDVELIEAMADRAVELGGLHVHVRRGAERRRGGRLASLARHPGVTVEITDRLTDEALWSRLERAAAVALPYRWGTHSGLLEAAHDLGAPVLAPLVGSYAAQGANRLRAASITADVRAARSGAPHLDARSRRRQRDALRTYHRQCYAAVAGA